MKNIYHVLKGSLLKIDMGIRPFLEKSKIYLETVVMILFSVMTIVISVTANKLTKQQIELEKKHQEMESSPIFLFMEDSRYPDYVRDLMKYYTLSQLLYGRNKLELDLFTDFDSQIFFDNMLYYFLGLDFNEETLEKLQEICENSDDFLVTLEKIHNHANGGKGNQGLYEKYGYYIDGMLDDQKKTELFSECDNGEIRFILNRRFLNRLYAYDNWYLIRNIGASCVIYQAYPFLILELDLDSYNADNMYFVIDDYFDFFAEYGKDTTDLFIRSKSTYFYDSVKEYLERTLDEYSFRLSDSLSIYSCIGLVYSDVNNVRKTEWYTIENSGLKRFEVPIGNIFPYKNLDELQDFGERKYKIADIYNDEIKSEIIRKLEDLRE